MPFGKFLLVENCPTKPFACVKVSNEKLQSYLQEMTLLIISIKGLYEITQVSWYSMTLRVQVGIPVILLRNLTYKLVNWLQRIMTSLDGERPTVEFPTVGTTIKFQFE
ncbi:hypothetical protein MAR_021500, partial [Mya arenaria]